MLSNVTDPVTVRSLSAEPRLSALFWRLMLPSVKAELRVSFESAERSRAVLDRFDIDYALCMYCGICVEVCPFDALFWSPDYEYSEYKMTSLLHDKEKLNEWLETVPETQALES